MKVQKVDSNCYFVHLVFGSEEHVGYVDLDTLLELLNAANRR